MNAENYDQLEVDEETLGESAMDSEGCGSR
jgi:hypothetical protein